MMHVFRGTLRRGVRGPVHVARITMPVDMQVTAIAQNGEVAVTLVSAIIAQLCLTQGRAL